MTIRTAPPPPNAEGILGKHVPHLLEAQSSNPSLVGAVAPAASHPLWVFTLSKADAQAADPLRRARCFGWRYLIETEGVPAVADIRAGDH